MKLHQWIKIEGLAIILGWAGFFAPVGAEVPSAASVPAVPVTASKASSAEPTSSAAAPGAADWHIDESLIFHEVTPQIVVNGNGVWAEAYKRGPVVVTYDMRSIGGEQVAVFVDVLPVDPAHPQHERVVRFPHPCGNVKLDFYPNEAGMYAISAQALDAEGKPIANRSRFVSLRYGGAAAERRYNERHYKLFGARSKPPAFGDVLSLDETPELSLLIKPAVSVIKPGEKVHLIAELKILHEENVEEAAKHIDANIYWRLKGPGKLTNIAPTEVLYEAPEDSECEAIIGVRIYQDIDEAKVYVTNAKVGDPL